MKKITNIIFIFVCLFFFLENVEAKKITVKFKKCVDGDTATFTYKGEDFKARFLAIDTPETKHPTKEEQAYGKEASEYTCKRLENAKKIVLEYDDNSNEKDMYNRHLVWVWLDNKLLQKDIINKGLAKVDYVYGKYKYVDELKTAEEKAKKKKIGIWTIDSNTNSNKTTNKSSNNNNDSYDSLLNKLMYDENGNINYLGFVIAIIIIIILFITNKNYRKKLMSNIKKK